MKTFVLILKWIGVVIGIGVVLFAYLEHMRDDEPVKDPFAITVEETSPSDVHQADYRERK